MNPTKNEFGSLKKHIDSFIQIDDEEFENVLTYFTVRKLRKNQILINAGDKVRHTYWASKGLLMSTFTDKNGKQHVIQFAIEHCWITDQNAFYNKEPAILDISCLEDTELLSLSYENREQLCADIPAMNTFFRRKANDSFTKQQKRLLTYLTSDSQERFEALIAELPQLMQRLPKKILAAYLGVSRETLSRFKK